MDILFVIVTVLSAKKPWLHARTVATFASENNALDKQTMNK